MRSTCNGFSDLDMALLYSSLLLPWERLISSIARHAGAMAFVCVGGGGG